MTRIDIICVRDPDSSNDYTVLLDGRLLNIDERNAAGIHITDIDLGYSDVKDAEEFFGWAESHLSGLDTMPESVAKEIIFVVQQTSEHGSGCLLDCPSCGKVRPAMPVSDSYEDRDNASLVVGSTCPHCGHVQPETTVDEDAAAEDDKRFGPQDADLRTRVYVTVDSDSEVGAQDCFDVTAETLAALEAAGLVYAPDDAPGTRYTYIGKGDATVALLDELDTINRVYDVAEAAKARNLGTPQEGQ